MSNLEHQLNISYKKLKRYVYHSSDYATIREMANYEENKQEYITKLRLLLESGDVTKFSSILDKIAVITLPKSINWGNNNENDILYNFEGLGVDPVIDKIINFIQSNIDIQLICTLWILQSGHKLVKELSNNYGNMLVNEQILFSNKDLANNNKLFKVYWSNYREWRDNAIKAVDDLYLNNKHSVMLMLDIKEFYGSVEVNIEEFCNALGYSNFDNADILTKLVINICVNYTKKVKQIDSSNKINNFLLPIGLIASNIIANWYLIKFDNDFKNSCNPFYYGRYVDDIICVMHHEDIKQIKSIDSVIKNKLNTVLKKRFRKKGDIEYNLKSRPELYIQASKLKCFVMHKDHSTSVFNKFKSVVAKQSSEFRFLPDLHDFEHTFNAASVMIDYSDSINKLRSIKEFNNNKFGVSSFLSKAIYMKIKQDASYDKVTDDIYKFFLSERNLLSYKDLWGKVFIYFAVTSNLDKIKLLLEHITNAIKQLNKKEDSNHFTLESVKKSLNDYKDNALIYALSYLVDGDGSEN